MTWMPASSLVLLCGEAEIWGAAMAAAKLLPQQHKDSSFYSVLTNAEEPQQPTGTLQRLQKAFVDVRGAAGEHARD